MTMELNINGIKSDSISEILYLINYKSDFEELCFWELESLFNKKITDKYYLTTDYLDISRSVFLKGKINILYKEKSLEVMEAKIEEDCLTFEEYKISFIKLDHDIEYKDRLLSLRKIGSAILGAFAIKDPKVELALTKVHGYWIFGFHVKNKNQWVSRKQKPFNYSHAMEVQLAKTVLNIAIQNDFDLKVVDPCCGIGTVLIEARAMDIDIDGYEINRLISGHCNENLEFFGFKGNAKRQDMHTIEKHYDIAILDIPYGQFSLTTPKEQRKLIETTRRISDKAVIISMENMNDMITESGFIITKQVALFKSHAFSRLISICQ